MPCASLPMRSAPAEPSGSSVGFFVTLAAGRAALTECGVRPSVYRLLLVLPGLAWAAGRIAEFKARRTRRLASRIGKAILACLDTDLKEKMAIARAQLDGTMTYRRRWRHDDWHWCMNCSRWPGNGKYESAPWSPHKPLPGSRCDECRVKTRNGNCRLCK